MEIALARATLSNTCWNSYTNMLPPRKISRIPRDFPTGEGGGFILTAHVWLRQSTSRYKYSCLSFQLRASSRREISRRVSQSACTSRHRSRTVAFPLIITRHIRRLDRKKKSPNTHLAVESVLRHCFTKWMTTEDQFAKHGSKLHCCSSLCNNNS